MEAARLLIGLGGLMVAFNVTAFRGFGVEIDFYIDEASTRYHVSKTMLRGIVKIENGWHNNVSPTGATGVGQFTTGTWNWLADTTEGKNLGMRKVTPQNRGTRFDPRRNKRVNTLATGLLAQWHIGQFNQRGIAITDANLYMAHNIGLDGFHRALLGRVTKEDIKNMRLNGMKRWMSVRDFIVYQKKRYHTHKLLANQRSSDVLVAEKAIAMSLPETLSGNQSNEKSVAKSQRNLRWIQPSDRQLVWINPQKQQ